MPPLFSTEKGTVEVTVVWETVCEQGDPVGYICERAVSELALAHEYNEHETKFVKEDAVLKESARVVYLKMRKHHEQIPIAEYKAKKKGEEYLPPPSQHKLTLHYSRPKSRGFMDKQRGGP